MCEITRLVVNQPMNPHGPPTYVVGSTRRCHEEHGKCLAINQGRVTGDRAYISIFTIYFEDGSERVVYQQALQEVDYAPDNAPDVIRYPDGGAEVDR